MSQSLCYFTPVKADVTDEIFFKAVENNPFEARENDVGTKMVLKFKPENIPFSFEGKGYGPFSHDEILTEMQESEWVGGI